MSSSAWRARFRCLHAEARRAAEGKTRKRRWAQKKTCLRQGQKPQRKSEPGKHAHNAEVIISEMDGSAPDWWAQGTKTALGAEASMTAPWAEATAQKRTEQARSQRRDGHFQNRRAGPRWSSTRSQGAASRRNNDNNRGTRRGPQD
jgi:hypothetical protein